MLASAPLLFGETCSTRSRRVLEAIICINPEEPSDEDMFRFRHDEGIQIGQLYDFVKSKGLALQKKRAFLHRVILLDFCPEHRL
jgi:hypothetical protein